MISNFHTHSTFCDGNNTLEEIVLSAIEKGFVSLGFSSHGYTDFDLSYCCQNWDEYINQIKQLKEKYKKDIQIYLGVEEDAFYLNDRSKFDYIIGSSHYIKTKNKYFSIDFSFDGFKLLLEEYEGSLLEMAEQYYSDFCDYISVRKPDIIGHFDLLTKYDELGDPYFSNIPEYNKIAEKYIAEALKSECIFEVNTGAISRGLRTAPYPSENLLYILKKHNAKLILSADSHAADTIDFGFADAKNMLKDIGFKQLYTLYNGEFVKYDI